MSQNRQWGDTAGAEPPALAEILSFPAALSASRGEQGEQL